MFFGLIFSTFIVRSIGYVSQSVRYIDSIRLCQVHVSVWLRRLGSRSFRSPFSFVAKVLRAVSGCERKYSPFNPVAFQFS